MGQYVFPDGTTAYVRNSTALNKLFGPDGKIYSAGGVYVTDSSGTDTQIATSSGLLYSEGQAVRFGSNVLGAGTTTASLSNYGISSVAATTAAGSNTYTIAAPSPGVSKTIYASAANSTDYPIVYTGSTARFIYNGSTSGAANLRVGLQSPYASVTMVGISTVAWLVTSYTGTIAMTT